MTMQKSLVLMMAMALASATVWAGEACCKAAAKPATATNACCKAGDTAYSCAHCNVVDLKAGKCAKCEAALKAMNVLALKDGVVTLCPCEAGCKCAIKADDATQCSCGKAVVTIKCPVACKVEAPKVEAPKVEAPKVETK
jgi:hypothetical protein